MTFCEKTPLKNDNFWHMKDIQENIEGRFFPLVIVIISLSLYFTSLYSYLLFHLLVELATIIITFGIFVIAWNSRRFIDNNFLLIIGISYFFIGGLDLMHTLVYKGMNIFEGYDANPATQLWISARFIEAVSFIAAFVFLKRGFKSDPQQTIKKADRIFLGYLAFFLLVILSIFYWKIFPLAYTEESGLTYFKKISEYIISALFLLSAIILFKKRSLLDYDLGRMLSLAIAVKIISELIFTLYFGVDSFMNIIGHLFKFFSFLILYKAILQLALMKPYNLLFLDLAKSRELLKRKEQEYRAIVEDQTELICRFQPDGKILFVNTALCRYLGKKPAELVGKKFISEVFKERQDEIRECISGLCHLNPVAEIENKTSLSGGKERWNSWKNKAIFSSKGKIVGYQSVGRDITSHKIAEEKRLESQKKLRKITEEKLIESHLHAGIVNRKISFLSELESISSGKNNKQEIIEYITHSAINISNAKSGLIYKHIGNGQFKLLYKEGVRIENFDNIRLVSQEQAGFLKKMLEKNVLISGSFEEKDIGSFGEIAELNHFMALPLVKDSGCKGFLFLGFDGNKRLESQEIEFLKVFSMHALTALYNSRVFE